MYKIGTGFGLVGLKEIGVIVNSHDTYFEVYWPSGKRIVSYNLTDTRELPDLWIFHPADTPEVKTAWAQYIIKDSRAEKDKPTQKYLIAQIQQLLNQLSELEES